jgi:hypothetical protein
MTMTTGYAMRLASVYATHWRRSSESTGQPAFGFHLGQGAGRIEHLVEGQLPFVLDRKPLGPGEITFAGVDAADLAEAVTAAEVIIFALPFPADQVVAALQLDYGSPDLNRDSTLTRRILKCCTDADIRVGGQDLASYIDALATSAKAEKEIPSGSRNRPIGLPMERHHLVFVSELAGTAPPMDDVVKQILYGIEPPYRPEFTELRRPKGLNVERDAYGAVSATISFLYGHADDVEDSVFLTTVQAVGTASRFQQIWEEAYFQVQEFQTNKQKKETGKQLREDLETLADQMGNLELDLAFSVETAADLGLRIPSLSIDDFHNDLYEVMQIRTRAHTVSQMFVRLGGSVRSELTAIESRERQQEERLRQEQEDRRRQEKEEMERLHQQLEDRRRQEREQEEDRRLRGALALGILSFLVAPLGFLVGFFGMNASQVHPGTSMWNWHYYHWVYLAAVILALIPLATFFILHGQALRRRRRQSRLA